MRSLRIVVADDERDTDRILAELAGFDYHVGKPYDVNALLSLLKPLSD